MKEFFYTAGVALVFIAAGNLIATNHYVWAMVISALGGIAVGLRDIYMERKYESESR